MREIRTYGSVGVPGGHPPPGTTRSFVFLRLFAFLAAKEFTSRMGRGW